MLLVERWADIPSFEAHKAGGPLERIHRIQEGAGVSAVIERFEC